uniref:Uncharacterized protein n=1 Tax=Ciona savignyi TaxID=51511 RepID=H2YPS2_CIOSA
MLCIRCSRLKPFPTNSKWFSTCRRIQNSPKNKCLEYSNDANVRAIAADNFALLENFITEGEESSLIREIDTKWKRLKYQKGHWDNAIEDYRELEISSWSKPNAAIIQRVQEVAFEQGDTKNNLIHVLDLAEHGFINPHVDSVRFCGRVIAGLSLLSPCVMKYTHKDDASVWFQALLQRRSLYIMKDRVRYDFKHEILRNERSIFKNEIIPKFRRVSVLCRSQAIGSENERPGSLFQPITLNENT